MFVVVAYCESYIIFIDVGALCQFGKILMNLHNMIGQDHYNLKKEHEQNYNLAKARNFT